jgi:hypothetical protein
MLDFPSSGACERTIRRLPLKASATERIAGAWHQKTLQIRADEDFLVRF